MSAALGITKYNLLLLSLARQLQISRHNSFVATCPAALGCPKGYTSVTVGVPPTDANTWEITRSGDTFYKNALHQKTCLKVAPLRVHAYLGEQPGVASLSFATPGYKSVALRAITNQPVH